MRAVWCVTFFWLVGGEVTGRCSRNLVLSLKLPSSTWVGALVPAEDGKDIVMYISWGGTRTLLYHRTIISWLLLLCFCIPSLPGLATVWISLWSGKVREAEWSLFPTNKKWETQNVFVPRRVPQSPAGFQIYHNYYKSYSCVQIMSLPL